MDNHSCEAVVITCIDFRFQDFLDKWIKENFEPKTYDRGAFAGAAKNLETILNQIETAHKLHRIKKVVLINHEDCGAYGEKGSEEKHIEDLKSAAFRIKKQIPNLGVDTYYLKLDGTFQKV